MTTRRAPAPTFNVTCVLTEGTLTEGVAVVIESTLTHARNGKFYRKSVAAGTFAGTYIDEYGEPYYLFRSGHINGTPQTEFGFPQDTFVATPLGQQ